MSAPFTTSEPDRVRTPWAWLEGFAWFLLAWPVLSLLALDQLDFADWETILAATLGPAAVGVVLLGVARGLDRLLGARMAAAPQAVPSTLRDLSNLGLTLAILLGANVALVGLFEQDGLQRLSRAGAGGVAVYVLVGCLGGAVLLRGLHRLRHGPPRAVDMGEGWDAAPTVMRLLGYLALIPSLLVSTVMIDYTLRGRPDFGPTAWIALPTVLLLGLRSAMARSPRYWARNPWEAWLRRQSLALPWWIVGLSVAVATAVAFVLLPFLMSDDEISTGGRVIAGVLLGPIGLAIVYIVGKGLWHELPVLVRRARAARVLARDPSVLARWEVGERFDRLGWPGPGVALWLRDGRLVVFEAEGDEARVVRWLERHAADARTAA